MKTCTSCKEEKPLKEFAQIFPKSSPAFRRNVCRKCNHEAQFRAGVDRHGGVEEFKDYRHRVSLKNRMKSLYGISIQEAEERLDQQGGQCKICENEIGFGRRIERNAVACIDHCHSTGKIRGVLCHKCNVAIGLFNESQEIIKRASEYLLNS